MIGYHRKKPTLWWLIYRILTLTTETLGCPEFCIGSVLILLKAQKCSEKQNKIFDGGRISAATTFTHL